MPIITVKNDAPELMELIPGTPEKSIQNWHCFKSPESMTEYLQSRTPDQFWCTAGSDRDNDPGFFGYTSLPQAFDMCRNGWSEGARRVEVLRDKITAASPQARRFTRWDVAGAYPNMGRCLAGNPLHMRQIDNTKSRRKPVLTLINHMGGLAEVDSDCFTNKCGVVAAIVDSIEAAGFSCQVIGLTQSSSLSGSLMVGTAVIVKEPGQHVDLGRMAFALGHVAMFRRFVFRVRSSDHDNKDLSGMGYTTDFTESKEGVFVLPSMNKNADKFKTETLAATQGLQYFISELQKQDCPAFPKA